jgi:hypothetical protein
VNLHKRIEKLEETIGRLIVRIHDLLLLRFMLQFVIWLAIHTFSYFMFIRSILSFPISECGRSQVLNLSHSSIKNPAQMKTARMRKIAATAVSPSPTPKMPYSQSVI